MRVALPLIFLEAAASRESVENCGATDSVLLQAQRSVLKTSPPFDSANVSVVSGGLPSHLPLCDSRIVDETCQKLQVDDELSNPRRVRLADVATLLSASEQDMANAWAALGIRSNQIDVGCQELCDAAVHYIESVGGVLPPTSDVACYTVDGVTTCDVDVDPYKLVEKIGGVDDDSIHPDNGPQLVDGEPDMLEMHAAGGSEGDDQDHDHCPYSVWEAVERICEFFRIFPASGHDDDLQVHTPEEPALVQESASLRRSASSSQSKIASVHAQAKAWVATVLGEMNGRRTGSSRSKWFGGGGGLSAESVRSRVLRTMNFVQRELNQGIHWVYPADRAKSSACKGALAYVWKGSGTNGQYGENNYPKCNPNDDPFSKNCAIDSYGKYYVYLCELMFKYPEDVQISSFIHEAVHHSGPKDVAYDKNQIRGLSQAQQLNNAANYQNFAQDVAEGKYGCKDDDGSCDYYKNAGYCSTANVKKVCQKSCGICRQGGSSCADSDSNCNYYKGLGYCQTVDNVKQACKRTCGLCR